MGKLLMCGATIIYTLYTMLASSTTSTYDISFILYVLINIQFGNEDDSSKISLLIFL